MCLVSNIGDGYEDNFPWRWPNVPIPGKSVDGDWVKIFTDLSKHVTRQEFDTLKKELEALKKVIAEAQKFDAATSQPKCDSPDKLALVRWLAQALGVDISDLNLNSDLPGK